MIGNPYAGMFTTNANMTPQQIAERRARIAALMPQFGKAQYIGEGLGQLFTGIGQGRQQSRLDAAESTGIAGANDMMGRLFGPKPDTEVSTMSNPGPLSVLGMHGATEPAPDPNSPQGIAHDTMNVLGKGKPTDVFAATLLAGGLPQHAVDGILMNVSDESGGNPSAVGDNGHAFGLAQWNGPRKAALLDFANKSGADPADPKLQANFLLSELNGSESAAGTALRGSKTAGEAGTAFLNTYERPAEQHRAAREAAYSGGVQPDTAPPQMPMDQLYQALQNPWLSQEQRSVITGLIDRNTQNNDPTHQMALKTAQLSYDQASGAAPDAETNSMMQRAKLMGLTPGTPEFKQFVMAGGGMRGGGMSLTPVYSTGADGKMHAYQLSSNGQPREITLPGGGEIQDPYGKAAATAAGSAAGAATGAAQAAAGSLSAKMPGLEDTVTQLNDLATKGTYTSAGRLWNSVVSEAGQGPTEGALARTQYNAIVDNQILPLLRDTFGAQFTAREGETLRATLGDANKTPLEKQAAIKAWIDQQKATLTALQAQGASGAGAPNQTTPPPSGQSFNFDAQGNPIP